MVCPFGSDNPVPPRRTAVKPDFAVARVGPATLAVGAPEQVDELVLVRLGMKPDLKITGQLFDRFQALDHESALRLISRDPQDLSRIFHPIFSPELIDISQLIGLAVNLQNPVKARILIKVNAPKNAANVARDLRTNPDQWLRLPDSPLLLYSQPPEIQTPGQLQSRVAFHYARRQRTSSPRTPGKNGYSRSGSSVLIEQSRCKSSTLTFAGLVQSRWR